MELESVLLLTSMLDNPDRDRGKRGADAPGGNDDQAGIMAAPGASHAEAAEPESAPGDTTAEPPATPAP
jgi:hypothetical protein